MFNYHDFVLTALLDSIGIMTDAWVRVQAIAHHEKGVLTEADLAQIDTKIVEKNTPVVVENVVDDAPIIEEPTV
jgi:hypothetical protein